MTHDWIPLPGGGWKLVNEAGELQDTLHCDPKTSQYTDSRGMAVGRNWTDAKLACEALAVMKGTHGKSKSKGR